MADLSFSVVILAAGKATRFKSEYPKVLHTLAGLPLGEYVVRAAVGAGPEEAIMVVGHRAPEVRHAFERPGISFIEQKEQLGTGHALMACKEQLEQSRGKNVVVLVADIPFLTSETIHSLVAAHSKARATATILTAVRPDPTGYGRIVRKKGAAVKAIVEEKLCTAAQKRIREINSGILCFAQDKMLRSLGELSSENPQGEYLLTDLVEIFNRRGEKVAAHEAENPLDVFGVNDRAELAEAERVFRERKTLQLMKDGVTIQDPATTYIDARVRVGRDTIIEPGVRLLGDTAVGSACVIRTGCVLEDATVGDRVDIRPYSIISSSDVHPDVIIGPFARLRDGAVIEQNARIGNFVEVKKSRVGRRTKAMHLTYLGDSELGMDANIGAGTVTCNFDGKTKHPTRIEDGVFIGSGSMLVAPVKVGRGAFVAAGSTITQDVPPESLAVGRAYQVNKEGWARKKKDARAVSEFRVLTRESGSATILDASGPITLGETAEELSAKIRSALGAGHRRVLINLSKVTYLDSAAIGVLASSLTAFRKAKCEFKLVAPSTKLLVLLEAARLRDVFDIFEDEGSALGTAN